MIVKIKDIVVLEEAAIDMEEGRNFYDRREPGIGEYFFDSVIADFESLRIYAGVHGKQYGFFRMLSKRFPFAIYYDINNEVAIIAAVLDMRQNPVWIHTKLAERQC